MRLQSRETACTQLLEHFGFDSGGASKEDASAAEGLKTALTANAADDDDRCAHWIPICKLPRALQYLEVFVHVLSSKRPEWLCHVRRKTFSAGVPARKL